jgi:hypothetical protein
MARECNKSDLQNLPECARDFIKLVIRKMRYRRKVRAEVMAELTSHFEDELRECKTDEEKEQKAQRLIEDFGDAKLLGVLLRRAKKRCRPLWRTVVARTFQTIGVLILCFILYCVYISLGKPTINVNYVEEATRLARPVADESLNAAPIYQKAIDVYKEPPSVKDETGTREISLLDAIKDKDWVAESTKEELASLKQWLSDNVDASEFFKQASEKPHFWWRREAKNFILDINMPELAPLRKIARMMVWQAKLKAYDGHIEEAFDDLLACYRAGRHLKGPRSLVEQLVGIGIQGLSTKNILVILTNREVDTQLLKHLQTRLEELMAEDTYTVNYEVEHFFALDFIQRCYTNNGRGSGHMIPGRVQEFMCALWDDSGEEPLKKAFLCLAISIASADRREINREFEKFYGTFEKCATKTPWQLHEENFDFGMDFDSWSTSKQVRYWPISVLVPAVGAVSKTAYRHKTQVEAVETTLAVIRFKQSTGNYPENLEGLVAASYLKKIPLDPFSDQPLVYKKTADNFTLYSVGLNFKDDGGQVYRGEKGKPQLWHSEFGDAVFWPVQK